MSLQIVLIDEHPETGFRMKEYLGDQVHAVFTCELLSARQLTDQHRQFHPDFVLVDTGIKSRDWIALCYDLNHWYPKTCTIIISNHVDNKLSSFNKLPGIFLVLDKTKDLDTICKLIDAAADKLTIQNPGA